MKNVTINTLRLCFILILLGALAFATARGTADSSPQSKRVTVSSAPLTQFTSGGHVLGFQNDGILVSNATYALRIKFVGANSVPPASKSAGQSKETAGPPFAQVKYPNLWDGITLTYDAPESGIMRSTYTLAPFAQVASIRLAYNAPTTVNADGSLAIVYDTGQVSETAPIAWQERNGQRVGVPVAFVTTGEREVGFALGEHDPHTALVIDPVLTWNTFLGSAFSDLAGGIAVDADGSVYVSGTSGATWGTPVRPFSGSNDDAFAAKLDSNGTLVWNTFLGGTGGDHSTGIKVDASGNVYVSGISDATWATPVRPFTNFDDAFAAKLDSNGALVWNTFLGGDGFDHSVGIGLDGSANVHVAGISGASWGTPVRAFTGFNDDAFAAKLDTDGALTWNTFLGGNGVDHGANIAVNSSGTVVVAGISTQSWGTPVRAFTGFNDDTFAAQIDSGGALLWNTFLGGNGVDHGTGIAMDVSGNAHVAGISTQSWGTPIRAFTGFNDDALPPNSTRTARSPGIRFWAVRGWTMATGLRSTAVGMSMSPA